MRRGNIWRYLLIKSVIRKKSWKLIQCFGLVLTLLLMNHSAAATTTHHNTKRTASGHSQSKSAALHKKKKYAANKKYKTRHLAKKQRASSRVNVPNIQIAQPQAEPRSGFVASIENKLIHFVHQTVAHLRYSSYKFGGSKFDTSKGIYIVDCSNYVDRVLETIYPKAYSSLVDWTGTDNPTTHDYYNFFTELPDSPKYNWTKVEDVEELRTGDILVFRYKNASGNETGGHVMIVMDKPVAEENNFLVRVADSASGGHSEDTRQHHVSGVGVGTLLLKKDPKTFQPSAFAWSFGSRWKRNVNFAMLRPVEIG